MASRWCFPPPRSPPCRNSISPTEIIPPSAKLYERLKRVDYRLPVLRNAKPVAWEDLAVELQQHDQVLCVVNTRRDCYDLFRLMPEGTIHLSALMCGEHRSAVIAGDSVAPRRQELPVRVISTQFVEAGVDIDFPVVYRALAGLASIAQAAGRCNREGKLQHRRSVRRSPCLRAAQIRRRADCSARAKTKLASFAHYRIRTSTAGCLPAISTCSIPLSTIRQQIP